MPRMPKVSSNRPKKSLSLGEKIEVILFHTKSKCSMRKLASEFNIGKTQAGAIIREQDKYIKLWQSGSADMGKHPKLDGIGLIIDKQVFSWYKEQKNEDKLVSGSVLQSKALEIAQELGNDEFKASSGWLDAFKRRHKIAFNKPEIENNLPENLEDWENELALVTTAYSADDVYSAHETGLFYQSVPDDTSNLKYKTCPSGELPVQRLTVLLCTSMTGQKEYPLIVTTDQQVKIDSDNIPQCTLESNSMAWITHDIMTKWFTELDQKMIDQNRKICLFLNNTPTHRGAKLKNIKIVYFPANLFGESQPMNHGIIQSFKTHYRLLMLQHLIAQRDMQEDGENSIEMINVSKAISWISAAWDVVSRPLIERSFKSAGFHCLTSDSGQSDNEPSLNEVAELLYAYDSDINAADYVNIDANLATEPEDAEHMDVLDDTLDNNNYEESMQAEKPVKELDLKSYSEAMRNLKFLEHFFVSRNDATGLSLVHKLVSHTESLLGDDDCCS